MSLASPHATAGAHRARSDTKRQEWSWPLLVLSTGLLILGLVFNEEISAAVATWERSTAYNHCWLVLPIAVWLGWTRRHRLVGQVPSPAPVAALGALGAGMVWLVAERLGIMEGRQFAALAVMLSLVLAVLGWRISKMMAAPLGYLIFLVPFGEFLVPTLQIVTAWMIVIGLTALGIPHYADALYIEIAAGVFLVAEACAGLRFIIASLAFGALYAIVMFRTPGRRLVVMLLALAVPVLANGLRALGIVVLGHHLGSAEAAAADHLIYGWAFFAMVLVLLTLAGLPFRQDTPEPSADRASPLTAKPWRAGALGLAAGVTLAFGMATPGLVLALDHAAVAAPSSSPALLTPPPGCVAATDEVALHCASIKVTARLVLFAAGSDWSAVVAERRRQTGQHEAAVTFSMLQGGAQWQGLDVSDSGATVAVAAWHGGQAASDGLRARAARAWNNLTGTGGRSVLAIVTLQGPPAINHGAEQGLVAHQQSRMLVLRVLAAQLEGAEGLTARAAALSNAP